VQLSPGIIVQMSTLERRQPHSVWETGPVRLSCKSLRMQLRSVGDILSEVYFHRAAQAIGNAMYAGKHVVIKTAKYTNPRSFNILRRILQCYRYKVKNCQIHRDCIQKFQIRLWTIVKNYSRLPLQVIFFMTHIDAA